MSIERTNPITGTEVQRRWLQANAATIEAAEEGASIGAQELHTSVDGAGLKRVFRCHENIGRTYHLGTVANEAAMLALDSPLTSHACLPGDTCFRSDSQQIMRCVSNYGVSVGDWEAVSSSADPAGTAATAVSEHNTATDSHADIRTAIARNADHSALSNVLPSPASQNHLTDDELEFFGTLPSTISDLMSNVEEVDADFVSISYNPSGGGGSSATLEDEITTDAPTAYWQLTETGGNLADSAGGGRTLTVTGSPVYAFCQLVRNLTSKGLKVVHGAYASRASDNLGVTPPWTGSWSVEFVVMLPEGIGAEFGCFTYGTSGTSGTETEPTNYQIYAAMTASRRPMLIWEYGAGNNVTFSPQIVLPIGFKAHIVWTKDAVNKIVKCFVNGICVYSSNYTQEPTGGSSSTIDVGRASTGSTVTGVLGHVAVYMGAVLSDARVMAHAVAAGVA